MNIPAAPFECWKGDTLFILDGQTFEKKFELEDATSFGSGLENAAIVRACHSGTGTRVSYYSVQTGEKLFEDDDFYDGYARIRGTYYELAEGYPQRIVIENPLSDESAYLADNYGNRVSGEYDGILPLFWIGRKGLYLAESYPGGRKHILNMNPKNCMMCGKQQTAIPPDAA